MMARRIWRGTAAAVVAMVLLVGACGSDEDDSSSSKDGSSTTAPRKDDLHGEVRVLAAASLTDAFDDVRTAFEKEHGDVKVTPSYGGSSALVQQVLDGAPADVLATADEKTMRQATDGKATTGTPEVLAHNQLVLVVAKGNPGHVTGLKDLAKANLYVGLCAAEVPCGKLGRQWLTHAKVKPSIDTNEPDVRSLLTKLESGDLDVGLVYATDAKAAGDAVQVVDVAQPEAPVTSYPIVELKGAANADAAKAFVAFVLGDEGQRILRDNGFAP